MLKNDITERISDIEALISKKGTQLLRINEETSSKPAIVSIIVTTFGADSKLCEALNSLVDQNFDGSIEILISYDKGSDRGTAKVIEEWLGSKWSGEHSVAFLAHDNMSLFRDRQLALEYASGKYISFLDYDNTYDRDKVRTHVQEMNRLGNRFSFSNQRDVNGKGNVIGDLHLRVPKDYSSVKSLLFQNYVDSNTIFLERSFYEEVMKPAFEVLSGKYFDGIIEDYFYALLAGLKGELHYIDKVLGSYAYHEGNITSRLYKRNSVEEFVKIANYNERVLKTIVGIVAVNRELGLNDRKIFSNYVNLISENNLQLLGVNSGTFGKGSRLATEFCKTILLMVWRLPYLFNRLRKRLPSENSE